MRRLLLLLALLPLCACAQNAVFELTVELPPDAATPAHWAHIQARINGSFSEDWAGTGDLSAFQLQPASGTPHRVQISVMTSDGAIMADPLSVKVTFCVSQTCTDPADAAAPQARYTIERVFYVGHRTSYTVSIAAIPTDPAPATITVGKCDVAGCRDGTTTSYCTLMPTMRHFCE